MEEKKNKKKNSYYKTYPLVIQRGEKKKKDRVNIEKTLEMGL